MPHITSSCYQEQFQSLWCERGDSNPHGFPRQILSLVRLPIPPLSQKRGLIVYFFGLKRGRYRKEYFTRTVRRQNGAAKGTQQFRATARAELRENVGQVP